jgi:hypothetical protein
MKNLKFFGVIPAAILAGVFLFTSCEQATDTEYITHYVPTPQGADVLATSAADLAEYLGEDSDYQVIAVITTIADAGEDLVVPATKTLLLYASLTPNGTSGLTIEGKVIVSAGGTLVATAANPVAIEAGGSLEVATNGTLSVANLTAGLSVDDESTVVFKGGNLAVAELDDAAGITTALGYIGSQGELTVTSLTEAKLSDIIAAIDSAEVTITTLTTQTAEEGTVTSLTIPSNLTIGEVTNGALTSTVTTLTVNGSYTPKSDDTLVNLTTLTVNGTLSAAAATLDALTDLTVNGELTSVGTGASAGIKITVGAEGEATLATVAKLLGGSAVAAGGELTATAVTAFDTDASLAVSAGSIVNGITLPGDTTITALATDAITIGDLTVASGTTFTLSSGKALTVADGLTLSISVGSTLAGTGTITTDGDATITIIDIPDADPIEDFTADDLAAEDFADALDALKEDAEVLAATVTLETDFASPAVAAIGSVAIAAASTATAVTDATDATTGTAIAITDGTTFDGILNAPTKSGTDDSITGTFTLSVDAGALKVADSGYAVSTDKYVILEFSGLKLNNSGLISPEVPAFKIGVKTKRAS